MKVKIDKVEWKSPDDLVPYEMNAKLHPVDQVEQIANSIKAFGWTQPIVVDKDNVVVIGHGRLMAAKHLNLEKVPVICRDDLTEAQIKACRLADNKTNESPWDFGKLDQELVELEIEGFDMEQFGFEVSGTEEIAENPYTGKVNIPQYEPTGEETYLDQLVDCEKTNDLIHEINESELPDDEKEFLRLAAQRHLAFNYKRIAEYYANASEAMQELMEKNALVIIDYDDAIANGYTRLNDNLKEMFDDVEG